MMDVDNDLEGQLLQKFSSMGTTDKEVLISEFQKLLGNQLNPAGCAFFLDMNNWNLQAAICSYYDFEQPNIKLPSMSFIRDVTIGEGESIPPNTQFTKTWRLQNSGDESWPPGCSLKFTQGEQMGPRDRVMVDRLLPGECTDISVDMSSPGTTGLYQGCWRMTTPTGNFFGEVIWVIIAVEENGLLGVTQQMSQFGSEFHHSPHHSAADNPFASPSKEESGGGSSSPFNSPNYSMLTQHGSAPVSPSPLSVNSPVRTSLFQSSALVPSSLGNHNSLNGGSSIPQSSPDEDQEMS